MIYGNTNKKNPQKSGNIKKKLREILDSEIVFYPYGSRYLGINDRYSDWDFLATKTDSTILEVKNMGFLPNANEFYRDTCYSWSGNGGVIHIVLTKRLAAKLFAQEAIKSFACLPFKNYLRENKISQKYLWEMLEDLYNPVVNGFGIDPYEGMYCDYVESFINGDK